MRSARRGSGTDVAGSRPYVRGDNMDDIDWSATARLSAARDRDEFIVRESYAEEAPRIVIVADRRPEIALEFPGRAAFRKRALQAEAIDVIRASAIEEHGFVGYLDLGDGLGEPFWLPPHAESLWEYDQREDERAPFAAPPDNVAQALEFLGAHPRSVPSGTFVFVLSDFLEPVPLTTWIRAIEQGLDVIPVVLQDPVWERTFPPVEGFILAISDARGRVEDVWLSARDVRTIRRANAERWERLLATFSEAAIDPIVLESSATREVLDVFVRWADTRRVTLVG